jgi:hypothetical protein
LTPLALAGGLEWAHSLVDSPRAAGSGLRLDPEKIDFGELKVGVPVHARARLVNQEDHAITLGTPRPDCGCVNARVGKRKLEPGQGTDLTFEFIPGPAASQKRSIELVDDHGDMLARLHVTCSVPPTLVASPEVLHAGWVLADANLVMQWIDVAYPIGDAGPAIEVGDLDVDLEGDLRLHSTPTVASEGAGVFRVGIACAFSEPAVFGALQSIVVLSSRSDSNLRGTARILVERVPPGVGAGWPSCHLGRNAGALPAVLRFPPLTAPVIGKGTGQFEDGWAPQWTSHADGWQLLVDDSLASYGKDRAVDLAIASGLLRIRLPAVAR